MGAGKSICILIADHNGDSLAALSRLLERNGYTVYSARTAAEAKDLAAAKRCNLFIGDIELPGESGLELMRELRERHRLPGIAVSGRASREDVCDALAAGFSRHIAKPVGYSDLLAAVEELTRPPPQRIAADDELARKLKLDVDEEHRLVIVGTPAGLSEMSDAQVLALLRRVSELRREYEAAGYTVSHSPAEHPKWRTAAAQ